MSLVSHSQRARSAAHRSDHADGEVLYYNADIIPTDPLVPVRANYIDNRAKPILGDPANYNMAVVRMSIPTSAIPIFNWRNFLLPDQDPNKADRVSLVYEATGDVYTTPLLYVANGDKTHTDGDPAGGIFVIGQYLAMLNNALATSLADLKTANPGATQTEPPYMTYSGQTRLFTLWIPTDYSTIPAELVSMYTTYSVSRLFGDIAGNTPQSAPGLFTSSPLQFRYLGQDLKTNTESLAGHPYFRMEQDNTTLPRWNDIQSIIFDTTSIPIAGELLSSIPGQERLNLEEKGSAVGAQRIGFTFTDFEPVRGIADRLPIQFFPQGPLRWYPLVGSFPMTTLSFSVSILLIDGTKIPLSLIYGDVLTVKLEFRRKDLNLT